MVSDETKTCNISIMHVGKIIKVSFFAYTTHWEANVFTKTTDQSFFSELYISILQTPFNVNIDINSNNNPPPKLNYKSSIFQSNSPFLKITFLVLLPYIHQIFNYNPLYVNIIERGKRKEKVTQGIYF